MNMRLAALIAATLWGFTYILTTVLPPNPLFLGAVRAVGGGLLLLLLARQVPPRESWTRIAILSLLNITIFLALLFVSAIRLPGGVAGTFQTLAPLFTILLAWMVLQVRPTAIKVVSILIGAAGVSLVILRGEAALDWIGIGAALLSVTSASLGNTLLNKWGSPPGMASMGLTAWQLLIGGTALAVICLAVGDYPKTLDWPAIGGLAVLAVFITALPFALWFRAVQTLGAPSVTPFVLVTPVVAFILDAVIRNVVPSPLQIVGVVLVMAGLLLNQFGGRKPATTS